MEPRDREVLLEVRQDVKDVKDSVLKVTVQQAVDHTILKDHERRSTNLEERVKPLEDMANFVRWLIAALVALGAIMELYKLIF